MSKAIPRLRGGLKLAGEKQRATALPLQVASVPERLVVTLEQYSGIFLVPCVAPGDKVRLGQPIALPIDREGVPLHAPVSGSIAALHSSPDAESPIPAIVLENDGRDDAAKTNNAIVDYSASTPEALRNLLEAGGIVGLGGAAFPTHRKLSSAPEAVHLLLNGVECEPHISCDDALMRARPDAVIRGGEILLHALGASRCTIAVEDDKPAALAALRSSLAAMADSRFELVNVPTFYPSGGERQLIAALWGKEVPAGGLPGDIGVVCLNVGTAAAVASLVETGLPLTRRIVTVTGHGIATPQNLEVRLGTPFSHLIAECGGYLPGVERVIAGGSMMGTAVEHDRFTVTKATNCILVATQADLALRHDEQPCIRCGDCADVCPAGLLPQELHRLAWSDDVASLARLGLADCIECGCCDHVCPSQIPLTATFVAARAAAREEGARAVRSDRWRTRFLSHTVRLEQLEAERQRKLKERRGSPRPP
jgi:electron transport complex protein RnfC